MKKILVMIFVCVMTAACTTTMGVKMDETKTSFIQKGRTTKSDAISQLGQPTSTERDSAGREILIWEYAAWQKNAMMISELKERTRLSVTIDNKGKVADYSLNKGGPEKADIKKALFGGNSTSGNK